MLSLRKGLSAMSSSKNKGFTLLEVMLAVTILSVGLVMVVRSYVTSLRAIKTSREFLTANLLLEEKIWQEEQERTRPEGFIPQEKQDEFDPPFAGFNYKISFEQEENLPSLYKSTFEVFWRKRNKEHSVSCVTYTRSQEE